MNKQTVIILGAGLVAALLVAMLMQSMLGAKSKPKILNEEPKTEILVAAKNLSVGDKLGEKDMKWQQWPTSSVFTGAITKESLEDEDLDDDEQPVTGRLRRNIAEGEPILKSALIKEEKGNFVAATLGDGMRAMAIKVKAASSVGGFITPGDYVDVIMTYDVRLPSDQDIKQASISVVSKKAAQTVLENVRVMAVDQEAKEVEETSVAKTITLEVSPKQSEKLALAEAMGTLSLALRKIGDTQKQEKIKATTDVRMSNAMQELLGNDGGNTMNNSIRIYNGSTLTETTVRQTSSSNGLEE